MSAPEKVRLKRKRQDDPLEALVLTKGEVVDDLDTKGTPQKRIRYRLVNDQAAQARSGRPSSGLRPGSPVKHAVRRLFHLKRLPRTALSQQHISTNGATPPMPVFEERGLTQQDNARTTYDEAMDMEPSTRLGQSGQKRPGKNSSLAKNKDSMQDVAARRARSAVEHKQNMQALADLLHEATLEELANIPKPTSRAKPRMSSSQSKARHERSLTPQETTSNEDADMADADDYVYDTYILAPSDESPQDSAATNIGYLVIDKDDEEFWESFIGDTEDGEQEEKDEDDENAEDHYAADYPEDEDDSDDEAGLRNAYTSRIVDDDEWDLREDPPSEDEDQRAAPNRSMHSSTVVRRWERILYGRPAEADA